MEQFAYYYDGKKSQQKKIIIEYNDLDNLLILHFDKIKKKIPVKNILLMPQVGNSIYKLEFSGGDICEIIPNNFTDAFIKSLNISSRHNLIYKIESNLKLVIFFTFSVILIAYASFQYGIPIVAKKISQVIPLNSNDIITENILKTLDKKVFTESTVEELKKKKYKKFLNDIISKNNLEYKYDFNLIFRKGNAIGANAIALPSGTIIVTDELINIIQDDRELLAILAHEVGHIVERHSLRQIIQGGFFGVILTIIIGDTSYISAIAASIPVFLTEQHYSRSFELEADLFAYRYLKKNNISTLHFANILNRFTEKGRTISLLSSHPVTKERIKIFIEQ